MYSSSSSECLCGECLPYGPAAIRTPFYEVLGQPLIYYAKVQPQNHNQRSRESRKDNCFVKAFRWYTQEHLPPRPEPQSRRAELLEFAAWLDMKCDEFLQTKRAEECCRALPNDTSYEADRTNTGEPCEPCRSKTITKGRSPWRKKQRHVNSKERGNTLEKCPQSLEFIMEPKDLSRPASECCQKISLNNKSKASAISFEMQAQKRPVLKSRSSVRNVYDDHCGCMPVEMNQNEGPNIGLPEHQRKSEYKRPLKQKSPTLTKEVSCQCPETKLVTVNADTQYQDSDWINNNKISVMSYCLVPSGFPQANDKIYARKEIGRKEDAENISCQCSLKIISQLDTSRDSGKYIDVGCCCTMGSDLAYLKQITPINDKKVSSTSTRCECWPTKSKREQKPVKYLDIETCTVEQIKCRLVKVPTKDYAAQTSDNAIDLKRDDVRKYPLFMKIVYADKLKEEFKLR